MENKVKRREQLKGYKVGNKDKDISKEEAGKKKRNPKLKKLNIKGRRERIRKEDKGEKRREGLILAK